MTIALSVIAFVALLVVLLWLLSLPDEGEHEERAGLVAGNWERLRDWWRNEE
ncbi:MAG: hypothetical protein WD067_02810 [Gaiellaceae bacterium]